MNVEFSPKSNYQSFHSDCAEELQKQYDKRWFTVSIGHAMEMLAFCGATADEIAGARKFISHLINLPQKHDVMPSYPKRELNALEATEHSANP